MAVHATTRPIRILGTGVYVPRTKVPSSEIDRRLGKREGWTERVFAIRSRYHASCDETTSSMAALAAERALKAAGIEACDLDWIVAACGVGEQPIPSTAVLVQDKLGLGRSGIRAFDINATCLSFVAAFDVVADAIALGRAETVLIVSSDIASCGLDWSNPEVAAIFGDGAAAVVLGRSGAGESGRLIASHMATYGAYHDACKLEAGGTRLSPFRVEDRFLERTTFQMDGRTALDCVFHYMGDFLGALTQPAGFAPADAHVAILHQASATSLAAVQRALGFGQDRLVHLFRDFGNQIATSIPHGLHQGIAEGKLKRGETAIVLGTSAGISLGGLVLEY